MTRSRNLARKAPLMLVLTAPLLMGGCLSANPTMAQLKHSYPDRQVFSFRSDVADGKLSYLCARDPDAAATKARARAAHAAYEAEIADYGTTFAKTLVAALGSDGSVTQATRAVNRDSDAWANKAALSIEARFRCLPVAGPGVGLNG